MSQTQSQNQGHGQGQSQSQSQGGDGPRTLSIRHVTRYDYTPPAAGIVTRMRLWPTRFDTQDAGSWTVTANGEPVTPALRGPFGVQEGLWSADGPLEAVEVVAEGRVTRQDDAGVVRGLKERAPPEVFLRTTERTAPDAAIRDLAASACQDDRLATLHALSAAVRDAIAYVPDTTDMGTQAAAALAQGEGVCQDHAHVFAAAARTLGIPARYVAGYYFPGDALPGTPSPSEPTVGAAVETHGWAEGHVPGLGWVGFDVANRVCPTREHVRVACHLDASRAALISGAVAGQTEERLTATVTISQAQQ